MDDKASNQMTSCAVHHFPKITSELNLHLWVETSCWEMVQQLRAPLLTWLIILDTESDPNRLLWTQRYTADMIWSTAKIQKKGKRIKWWMFHLIGFFFLLHICTEIFAHLCSYLVSKALLKKLPVNIWEGGINNLNLHIQNTREDRRVDGWVALACSFH